MSEQDASESLVLRSLNCLTCILTQFGLSSFKMNYNFIPFLKKVHYTYFKIFFIILGHSKSPSQAAFIVINFERCSQTVGVRRGILISILCFLNSWSAF